MHASICSAVEHIETICSNLSSWELQWWFQVSQAFFLWSSTLATTGASAGILLMNRLLPSHGCLRRGCSSCPSLSNSNARVLNAGQNQEFEQSGRGYSVYRRIGAKRNFQRIGHSRSFWHANYKSGQIWGIRKLGRDLFEQQLSRSSSKHCALDKLKGVTERWVISVQPLNMSAINMLN